MKITKKHKMIAAVAAGAVLFFWVGRSLVVSLSLRLTHLRQQIKLAEGQLKKGLRVQRNKDTIAADYKICEPYFKRPQGNEKQIFAELLREVERLVSSLGATIVNLTPKAVPDVNDVSKEYKANFRVEASFPQLLEFLSEVQESKRLIKLEKVTITPQGDQASTLRVEGAIGLAVPL